MPWNEPTLFIVSKMKLIICSQEGNSIVLDVSSQMSIDNLKIRAVSGFYETDSIKASVYYRLVLVRTGLPLHDGETLSKVGLEENDELLLIKKRVPQPNMDLSQDGSKSSSCDTAAIESATAEVTPRNQQREVTEPPSGLDFHTELRKILLTLIDTAQKLLCLNPQAVRIFEDAEKLLTEKESPPSNEVNPEILKQLTDMGFTEQRAKRALRVNRMLISEAIQWLIDNTDNDDVEEPEEGASGGTDLPSEDSLPGEVSGTDRVMHLLERLQMHRKREFKPNLKALRNLVDMGFTEDKAVQALRSHGNNEEDACESLLMEDKSLVSTPPPCEEGLDPNSRVYQAIVSNPEVQLGLCNPRSLIALLHMLENPRNTQQWLNDPDTGRMLIQVSRIYQAEKHDSEPDSTQL